MKNQISDTLRNYFTEMIKNAPKLEWKDNIKNDSLICSTSSTQFGDFKIKKYYDEVGYYGLYLNDNPIYLDSTDINELMDLANYLYRQKNNKGA